MEESGTLDDIRPDWSRHSTSHGDSSFALARDEVRYTAGAAQAPAGAMPPESVLQVGHSLLTDQPIRLSETDQEHGLLVAAPPGVGKTMGIIYQGILREAGHRSVFVIDPKQEIERDTAGWLAEHHRLQTFAPLEPARSAHYNPLAHIRTYLEARAFAESWITNTRAPDDRHSSFWTNAESLILTAAVLHLIQTSPMPPPLLALAQLLRLPFTHLAEQLQQSASTQARESVAQFLDYMRMAGETAAGVMMGLAPRFDVLTAPEIATVTRTNDFDFAAMGAVSQPPYALYLSIPDYAAQTLQPLSAQFIAQMFTAWIAAANASGGQLTRPIVAYLDEFTNAGRIPEFHRYISMARARRIALIICVQAFAQLRAAYGIEQTHTILTSTAYHVIFPRMGQDEAEFYSRRIGQTTVQTLSQSRRPHTLVAPFLEFASDESEVSHVAGVPLVRPEELVHLPAHEVIVLTRDTRPLRLRRVCWFEDEAALRTRHRLPYVPPARAPDPPAAPLSDLPAAPTVAHQPLTPPHSHRPPSL